jgi:hypothetical protein
LGDLLEEAYRIDHSDGKLWRPPSRQLQERQIDRQEDVSAEELGGCNVEGIKALEAERKQVVDTRGHHFVGE